MFGSIAQSVYPSSFQVADSVNFMLNCFLGGLGYVFGPMLGTLVLYFGWDLLFELGQFQLLVYSSAADHPDAVYCPTACSACDCPQRKGASK